MASKRRNTFYQNKKQETTEIDEKGIIMGEFGFITADGVYHLTVYATDENGDFKILKMKNIKIGLPMEKLMMHVAPTTGINPAPVKEMVENMMKNNLQGVSGCSGCLIPTVSPTGKERESNGKLPPISASMSPVTKDPDIDIRFANINGIHNVGTTGKPFIQPNLISSQLANKQKFPSQITGPQGNVLFNQGSSPGGPTANQNTSPFSPTKGSQGNIPQKEPRGHMKIEDLMGILYKFNYTLKFHGHHEVGDRAGNKEGGYFFNGRDGFGRDVKYIANEFGYQPNISLVELDSDNTPKEETEKLMNRLKGYEFKWFYLK
ncbi:hypothetical protein AAG570_009065 [Ranatra chinensis]|uniref:Uncharacterized protein n=1 Tax=Ranatra chinensis TaxID=642074 RepID=A0ABD0ZG11_9HEMI